MSRKQFEHIEHQFREAAENFQPPANPEAWEKMNQLLDQEQSKKRRPLGFWIWPLALVLIMGGAGLYYYTRPASHINAVVTKDPGYSKQKNNPPAEKVHAGSDKPATNNEENANDHANQNEVVAPQ